MGEEVEVSFRAPSTALEGEEEGESNKPPGGPGLILAR